MEFSQKKHIVKKQILELQLNSPEGSFDLQNQVSRIYQDRVIHIVDSLLSEYSSPDIVHRIDILEINLGSLDINNLESEFISKISTELQKQLTKSIIVDASDTIQQPKTSNGKSSSSQKIDFGSKEYNYLQRQSSHINNSISSKVEILSYFIQEGILPWCSQNINKQELEKLFKETIDNSPATIEPILLTSFQNQKQLKRIIYQFSDSILLQIVQLLFPYLSLAIADYQQHLKELFKQTDIFQTITARQLRLEIWQGIFLTLFLEQNNQIKQNIFIQKHLLYIATTFHLNYLGLVRQIEKVAVSLKKQNKSITRQISEILKQITSTSVEYSIEQDAKITEAQSSCYTGNSMNLFTQSDEIYITNAGLILIWPFLNSFFENLGLVENKSFIDLTLGDRAAFLLQYVVDHHTEIAEHILPLNKLLCGLDLSEPIDTNIKLTEQEQTESENLLSAVIHNWSILKSTSIDGFRTAFLQRNGILRVRNGSWLLQVERETYDILLDRIPWTIRIIKLPWMDDILSVEW